LHCSAGQGSQLPILVLWAPVAEMHEQPQRPQEPPSEQATWWAGKAQTPTLRVCVPLAGSVQGTGSVRLTHVAPAGGDGVGSANDAGVEHDGAPELAGHEDSQGEPCTVGQPDKCLLLSSAWVEVMYGKSC
jgi:hypothetical protein